MTPHTYARASEIADDEPELAISTRGLTRRYRSNLRTITAVDSLDLDVPAGAAPAHARAHRRDRGVRLDAARSPACSVDAAASAPNPRASSTATKPTSRRASCASMPRPNTRLVPLVGRTSPSTIWIVVVFAGSRAARGTRARSRMAFGFAVLAWLVGWFSGQAHQLFAAGEPILEWVSGLAPVVAAMTWIIPLRRLEDWADAMSGTLATDLASATGRELPVIYGATSDAAYALLAIVGWALTAGLAFRLRRSLA